MMTMANLVNTPCFSRPACSVSNAASSSLEMHLPLDQWIIQKLASPNDYVQRRLYDHSFPLLVLLIASSVPTVAVTRSSVTRGTGQQNSQVFRSRRHPARHVFIHSREGEPCPEKT